jgi:hypothetical protein
MGIAMGKQRNHRARNTSRSTLAGQLDATGDAMPYEMLVNRVMRAKILWVLATAILAFEDDGSAIVPAHPVAIRANDWRFIDEAFEDGFFSPLLSANQRKAWTIAYEAARRVLIDSDDLPPVYM